MKIYTVKEVSKIIGSNTDYVYKLIKSGNLPAIKLGAYKVTEDVLYDFLHTWTGWDMSNPMEPKLIGA